MRTVQSLLTHQEVDAYTKLSAAWAEIERQHYGTSVVDDPRVKTLGLDWMTAFQFALTIQHFLSDPQVQAVLATIAPQLAQKLIEVETATGTFLAQARALLDGLLGGVTPAPGPGGVTPVIRSFGCIQGAPGSTMEGVGGAWLPPEISGGSPKEDEDVIDDIDDDVEDDDEDCDDEDDAYDADVDDDEDDADWDAEGVPETPEQQSGGHLQPGGNPPVNPVPGPPPVEKK